MRANASTSAKTLPAAAPAAFGPLTPATAAASAAAFFAVPASSTPTTSLVLDASKPARRSTRSSCVAKTLSTRSDDERRAVVERVGRVARAADAGDRAGVDALGDVGAGQRAERRDEALGQDEHGGPVGDRGRVGLRRRPAARTAGTAKQTMSARSNASRRAVVTLTASGSVTSGR